jgi:hypothetical protein
MKKTNVIGCAVVAALALAGTAQGSVVFENSMNNAGWVVSDTSLAQHAAGNFILTSAATIDRITFWGSYAFGGTPADSFVVRFHDVSGMKPGAVLSTEAVTATRTFLGVSGSGYNVYEYGTTLSTPFAAAGATTYWISIVNTTSDAWVWAKASADGLGAYSPDGSSWNTFQTDVAMRLEQVVPAPGSVGVAMVAGVLGVRRRRQ